MSGAETARHRVVQRRIGGAETAAPKCPSPDLFGTKRTTVWCGRPYFSMHTYVFYKHTYVLYMHIHLRLILGRNL